MKTRNGFVSNSSSSSFIIVFDKRPKSVLELQNTLFPHGEQEIGYFDYSMTTDDIASTVFRDLKGQRPASPKRINKMIREGHFPGAPDYFGSRRESDRLEGIFHKKYPQWSLYGSDRKITDPEAIEMADSIRELARKEQEDYNKKWNDAGDRYFKEEIEPKIEGKVAYVVEYADDGGQSLLEHGGIFNNITHFRISHH